ncbi:hypothetical protein IPF37_01280 [bacterium]|nr:MAG: hypothetical protein IPF37_01280 [bacterium]
MKKIIMMVGFGLVVGSVHVFAMGERRELDNEITDEMDDEDKELLRTYTKLLSLEERIEKLKDLEQTPRVLKMITPLEKKYETVATEAKKQLDGWFENVEPVIKEFIRVDQDFSDDEEEEKEGAVYDLGQAYDHLIKMLYQPQLASRAPKPTTMEVAKVLGEVIEALLVVQKKMNSNLQNTNDVSPDMFNRYKRILKWTLGGLFASMIVVHAGNYMDWWVMVVPTVRIPDIIESLANTL